MLARNFKSAADLGISERAYRALITVLGMLERGELKHTPDVYELHNDYKPEFSGIFNMEYWDVQTACGTVACIGGTCELIGQFKFENEELKPLWDLFYPTPLEDYLWSAITPEQSAAAIRSYLSTGRPDWVKIVRG